MVKQRFYKILALLTLPLVVGLFYNQAANQHWHKLENGIVVEHAHPFERSSDTTTPFQNHHHSNQDFIILEMLFQATTLLLFFFVLIAAFFTAGVEKIGNYITRFVAPPDFSANLLRAPPAFN